ncbi:MAG: malto-oligosyltrehalose trehalohydrolase [Parachlamydiaceae bacterium]|nr:malto-oligosyltrehalose trehalohydrolase [Parachlamydiaceae bacterium]
MKKKRRYPIGAEYYANGVHFRVWAPDHKKVKIVLEKKEGKFESLPLKSERGGYFSVFVPKMLPGDLYSYCLGDSEKGLPDPASRFQPYGVEGPSSIIDPHFEWTDRSWPGVSLEGQILYEMHIGTFTKEGTFKAAISQLSSLATLGITTIELMPICEFPGHFGWGYDGVNLFAPFHNYGTPDDLKSLINECHNLKIGIILDVVYNHFGPEGNTITQFTNKYLNPEEINEWGDAINFDHPSSREFFLTNAKYWIEEFHFDGLRVDATPWFYCKSKEHILAALTRAARSASADKNIIVIGEDETQDVTLLKKYEEDGYQFDGVWNDDFHHSACVRLKGKREAYYTDYLGSPQEFISALKYGYLYQGQYYTWQKKGRGSPTLNQPSSSFIIFIENHDQVANSGNGKRMHQVSDPGNYKAISTLLLLGPNTPLLFQGQEFGSSAPFFYFADHKEDLNLLIKKGRTQFLAQFSRLRTKNPISDQFPDPSDLMSFSVCKLDFTEREKNKELYRLYCDLIALRQKDPVFKQLRNIVMDGAVLGTDAFLIRFFGKENGDRLLLINFGIDLDLKPGPEPLLFAGENVDWEIILSTESIEYGGEGTPSLLTPTWRLPAHSTVVLGTIKKEGKREKIYERQPN